jgi:hypothetical protein
VRGAISFNGETVPRGTGDFIVKDPDGNLLLFAGPAKVLLSGVGAFMELLERRRTSAEGLGRVKTPFQGSRWEVRTGSVSGHDRRHQRRESIA